ncbi:maleylpyruvate isomerase N-terminal domain-containing protein [Nocardioides sp. SR21]|uniref:maleylpyruvate isomerase N-terminal domain-containing protein n=1 Tax=Nocardioides sp. SR21 TaxID=2919501 RepID=UPI001FA9B5A5|nr:maleylpyruvate isomerase N-terminal domain-containing protein [Nocardioides sp. SR21]
MALTIDLETGRTAFVDSVRGFVAAVDGLDEWALLGASRCHGWTRLDVVTHVLAGWQEMLSGFVSPVDDQPSVDAASYWPAFDEVDDDDPVLVLMAQRRRTAAYARPDDARRELRDVADAVLRGAASCADRPLSWQGHVFTAGDFLTIWAVEDVLHQLDLLTDPPVPSSALDLASATVAALDGAVLADRLPTPS